MVNHNAELKKRLATYLSHIFQNCEDDYLNMLVLDRFLWTATEDNNENEWVKYKGQPYWSEEAIKLYQKNNIRNKKKDFTDLRHEHLMPRKVIKEKILTTDKSKEAILEILNLYSYAVVITKEEDKVLKEKGLNTSMPDSFYKTGRMLDRYDNTGIVVLNVENQDLKEITFN